jgi:hypothetical protein
MGDPQRRVENQLERATATTRATSEERRTYLLTVTATEAACSTSPRPTCSEMYLVDAGHNERSATAVKITIANESTDIEPMSAFVRILAKIMRKTRLIANCAIFWAAT